MAFSTIYIKEAHAVDVWPVGEGLNITTPKTVGDRIETAARFVRETGYPMPVLSDSLEDRFEGHYAAWPTRFYIIHEGRVAFIAQPKHATFELHDLEAALESLLVVVVSQKAGAGSSED